MSRLAHSPSGSLRAMQISTAQVFAFVEGGLDRPFVERLLTLFVPAPTRVRVVAIKETPGGTGGKPALVEHFRRLKRKGHLLASAWGKPFVSLFFLDKDADDALRTLIHSPHIAYTPTYDLEGSLFCCGDVLQAVSGACHLTRHQSETLLGDFHDVLETLSKNWADWITLCLISQYKKKNFGCTFDRVSALNSDPNSPPDPNAVAQWKTKAQNELGLSEKSFERLYSRFHGLVAASILAGQPLRYFKGKWLKHALQQRLESQPKIPDSNINGMADRALAVLVTHVAKDTECKCCVHYSDFVKQAIEMLHSSSSRG